jgi:hypothetical protein
MMLWTSATGIGWLVLPARPQDPGPGPGRNSATHLLALGLAADRTAFASVGDSEPRENSATGLALVIIVSEFLGPDVSNKPFSTISRG